MMLSLSERNVQGIQIGRSNQVLVYSDNPLQPSKITYYLPCYVRFKAKGITKLSIQEHEATVSGTLLIDFYYGEMDKKILNQFIGKGKKAILVQFDYQESIQLRQQKGISMTHHEDKKLVNFTIRTNFTAYVEGDVFYSPFELLHIDLSPVIQTVKLDKSRNADRSIEIKFNCMYTNQQTVVDYGQNCQLADYSIAPYFICARFTNSAKKPFPIARVNYCRPRRELTEEEKTAYKAQRSKMYAVYQKCQARCGEGNYIDQGQLDGVSNHDMKDMAKALMRPSVYNEMEHLEEWEDWQENYEDTKKGALHDLFKVCPFVDIFCRCIGCRKPSTAKKNESYQEEDSERMNFLKQLSKQSKQLAVKHKIEPYHYAHFRICLYKYPSRSLISIFFPLMLLGVINLFVFYQDNVLGDRIASIATLALAYIAFIPEINENIPENPGVIAVEILILLETFVSVLSLFQSFEVRNRDFEAHPYNGWQDPLFVISALINVFTFALVFFFFLIHKFYWEKQYLRRNPKRGRDKSLLREEWFNRNCDKFFGEQMDGFYKHHWNILSGPRISRSLITDLAT